MSVLILRRDGFDRREHILIDAGFNLSEIDLINQEIETLNFEE